LEHVDEMSYVAMQVIYHSALCYEPFRKDLLNEMVRRKYIEKGKIPPRPACIKELESIDLESFYKDIKDGPCARLIEEGKL
jgi:mannosyl-3-phosphoglycerate synthase